MGIYYCISAKGFYDSDFHDHIPENSLEISQKLHAQLLDGESQGQIIMPPDEEHELPWITSPAPPTVESIKASKMAEVEQGFEAALVSTLVLSQAAPSAAMLAIKAALMAAEDPEGLAKSVERLNACRGALEARVKGTQTPEELHDIKVFYPV